MIIAEYANIPTTSIYCDLHRLYNKAWYVVLSRQLVGELMNSCFSFAIHLQLM